LSILACIDVNTIHILIKYIQWINTFIELSYNIEGTIEKVYIFHTPILWHQVRPVLITCHFPQQLNPISVFLKYKKLDNSVLSIKNYCPKFYFVYLFSPGSYRLKLDHAKLFNGTPHLKNVNNCLNTNIYFYLETSGGQSSNLYLIAVHFFNTSIN